MEPVAISVPEGRPILTGRISDVLPGLAGGILYRFPPLNPHEADRTVGYYRVSLRDDIRQACILALPNVGNHQAGTGGGEAAGRARSGGLPGSGILIRVSDSLSGSI